MKTTSAPTDFDQGYQTHFKHLKLKGLTAQDRRWLRSRHPAHGRLL
ncbi:MAG: hypothetical protein WCH44_18825 [Betaproteobacteria bacterium]